MNYLQMVEEYETSAINAKEKVKKYKKLLKEGKETNLEAINSKILGYMNIYWDCKETATLLRNKAKKVEGKGGETKRCLQK